LVIKVLLFPHAHKQVFHLVLRFIKLEIIIYGMLTKLLVVYAMMGFQATIVGP
jgi:hypothetical protein